MSAFHSAPAHSAAAPPPEWATLRDRWETLHTVRTLLIVSGFTLLAFTVVFFDVA